VEPAAGLAVSHLAVDHGRIALVDDEVGIRETVSFALRRQGYTVEAYADGAEAWARMAHELPDVAILDILMPRVDGLELCRRLRARSASLPLIFLTSKDDEFDRVLGLELGADDYLCKPFSMRELLARVRVLLRRLALLESCASPRAEDRLRVDGLSLDLQCYTAAWQRTRVPLTVTEFRMVLALARHPGHVKTREQLMHAAYPHDAFVSERTIDSHIKRIRRKFADVDAGFAAIETVHGLGYRYRSPAVGS
jgi:two-component system response regulator ChvI